MASSIHPTVIIDSTAHIGSDVEIGPYSIIGPDVEIGDGTWIQNHVTILGPTKIGKNNRFFAYGSIGQQSQDLKYKVEPTYLEIGDDNTFREFCTVHRATSPEGKTIVGSHNHFLAYCHIAHDCVVGNHCIFSNNGTLAGHVIVEDHAILGGLSAVHQFCRIGRHSFTGGCSKIVQDIPPFTTVDGNPARARGLNETGLKRRGCTEAQIRAIYSAYRTLYRKGLNTSQAVEEIRGKPMTQEVEAFVTFIESARRGFVSAGKSSDDEGG